MKFMKALSAIMVAALLGAVAVDVSARPRARVKKADTLPNFISFSGKIKEIRSPETENAGYKEMILVQNDEGAEMAFRITDDTFFVTDKKAEIGADIIGFYDGKLPMILIYPPQPEAVVIAVGLEEGKFIKVDRFNKKLLSEDRQLKLNIGPNTEIILQNGEKFCGDLTGRALVVLYSVTTRSIPPQTTPEKIVVLFERAVPSR